MAPRVTTRIISGGTTQDVVSVSFGPVPPSSKGEIVIIDAGFSGFQSVGEVGIGVASSNLPDGPSGVLFFDVFDSPEDVIEPTSTFSGVAGDNGAAHVEDVGMRGQSDSKYVALMVKAQDEPLGCACVTMKWFFGFSKEA